MTVLTANLPVVNHAGLSRGQRVMNARRIHSEVYLVALKILCMFVPYLKTLRDLCFSPAREGSIPPLSCLAR